MAKKAAENLNILASSRFELEPDQALEWLNHSAPAFVWVLAHTLRHKHERIRDAANYLQIDLMIMLSECADAVHANRPAVFDMDHNKFDFAEQNEDIALILAARNEDELTVGDDVYKYLADQLVARLSRKTARASSKATA